MNAKKKMKCLSLRCSPALSVKSSACEFPEEILYKRAFRLKLSGNEVYYTNSSILPVKNMLCSKLHFQNVSI